jgi:hypothetical protein
VPVIDGASYACGDTFGLITEIYSENHCRISPDEFAVIDADTTITVEREHNLYNDADIHPQLLQTDSNFPMTKDYYFLIIIQIISIACRNRIKNLLVIKPCCDLLARIRMCS